jgi:hypothetical protein
MPVRTLLQSSFFEPKDIEFLATAYEDARQAAGLVDANDPRAVILARKIIDAARRGVRDPALLREQGLTALQAHAVLQAPETPLDA